MAIGVAIENPEWVRKLVVIDSAGMGKEFQLLYKLANLPVFGRLVIRPNRWGLDNYFMTMEVVVQSSHMTTYISDTPTM
jgi:hypothetical protein